MTDLLADPVKFPHGVSITLTGVIEKVRLMTTRQAKRKMGMFEIATPDGQCLVEVFPDQFETYGYQISNGLTVTITGSIFRHDHDGRRPSLILEEIVV